MNTKDFLSSGIWLCIWYVQILSVSFIILYFCVQMQLRRECSLAELMDQETCMVKQIRSLDSDMQTLVYENYNKFISATGGKKNICYS